MGTALTTLRQDRWGEDWLVGLDGQRFWPRLKQFSLALERPTNHTNPQPAILIAEPDPLKFLAAFFAAHSLGYSVLLANPQWGNHERQVLNAIAQPQWSNPVDQHFSCYPCPTLSGMVAPLIAIPTGGSGGTVKFTLHTWATLMASVQGFCHHFGTDSVSAYCVLPLYHVSGLMQALRVFTSGGQLAVQPYRALKQGQLLTLADGGFLSLVPTQLQDLLDRGDPFLPWLRRFRAVLLGGAPPWPALLHRARAEGIPLALTYGMTETASQVATLLPEEFLAGHNSSGRPLSHASLKILDYQGKVQPPGLVGQVVIEAESLAWGYLGRGTFSREELGIPDPQPIPEGGFPLSCRTFTTDDVGYVDGDGYLYIVGRSSTKLITGGENVFPEEIEAALLATGQVQDACVVGLPDAHWGQRLCALVGLRQPGRLDELEDRVRSRLSPFKVPKLWIWVPIIPRTPQGKISRKQALVLAEAILGLIAFPAAE
ncbi:MAG: AMP-binding protein [Nodosilinea sp.]